MKVQHPHKHDRKMCLKNHQIIATIGVQLGASNEDCFRLPQTTMLNMLRCSYQDPTFKLFGNPWGRLF